MELTVTGRRALIAAGDASAAALAARLLDEGATVTVIAPEVTATIQDLAERGLLTWAARPIATGDLADADLVLTGSAGLESTRPSPSGTGSVVLVGGGPGDPGLLTVAGREALEAADVVVTDRLAPLATLADLRPDVEIVDVAKVPGGRSTPQQEINDLLIAHARAGRAVVRLKGGDPFVFGRGGEEVEACVAAGVPVRVIPGVTSAIAAAAAGGVPVTHRGVTQGFTVISGHVPPGHPDSTLDYRALATAGTTIVVLMGVRTLGAICAALVEGGLDPATPAAVVADATLPSQHVVRATVATIDTEAAGLRPPAVAVIGPVVEALT